MDEITIFDRRAVRAHRDRAARQPAGAGFLFDEVAERLTERLDDIRRPFRRVLDLGSREGAAGRLLRERLHPDLLVSVDAAAGFARQVPPPALVAEAEAFPFAAGAFDLALSNLDLHWTNDLPGALLQIRRSLGPDGLLLASLFGGQTLVELRDALSLAELEFRGGAGPRVSPFADVRDAGALLQRAGFALPVIDRDVLTVTYPDAMALMRDLRSMGETNAVRQRSKTFTGRSLLFRAAEIYQERFGLPDGRVPASFQVLYLTAWAPHESQQQPLRPGSAKARLSDALAVPEQSAGEVAQSPPLPKPPR